MVQPWTREDPPAHLLSAGITGQATMFSLVLYKYLWPLFSIAVKLFKNSLIRSGLTFKLCRRDQESIYPKANLAPLLRQMPCPCCLTWCFINYEVIPAIKWLVGTETILGVVWVLRIVFCGLKNLFSSLNNLLINTLWWIGTQRLEEILCNPQFFVYGGGSPLFGTFPANCSHSSLGSSVQTDQQVLPKHPLPSPGTELSQSSKPGWPQLSLHLFPISQESLYLRVYYLKFWKLFCIFYFLAVSKEKVSPIPILSCPKMNLLAMFSHKHKFLILSSQYTKFSQHFLG